MIEKHVLFRSAYLNSSMQYNDNIRKVICFNNFIGLFAKENN